MRTTLTRTISNKILVVCRYYGRNGLVAIERRCALIELGRLAQLKDYVARDCHVSGATARALQSKQGATKGLNRSIMRC